MYVYNMLLETLAICKYFFLFPNYVLVLGIL